MTTPGHQTEPRAGSAPRHPSPGARLRARPRTTIPTRGPPARGAAGTERTASSFTMALVLFVDPDADRAVFVVDPHDVAAPRLELGQGRLHVQLLAFPGEERV